MWHQKLKIFYLCKDNYNPIYNDIKFELKNLKKTNKKYINVCLTGGKSSHSLQKSIIKSVFNHQTSKYYLSDERLESLIKNVDLIKRNIKDAEFKINNINTNYFHDKSKFIKYFNNNLPTKLDILFLSFGSHGHLASLFNNFDNLSKNRTIITDSFDLDKRISISYEYILKTRVIYLFILNRDKAIEFKNLYNDKNYPFFLKNVINRSKIYTLKSLKKYFA